MSKHDKYEWTRQKTLSLIKEYQAHPTLWNAQLEEHRDRDKRTKAIKEISTKLSVTVSEINRKIHNLRNQVAQEMQKLRRKKSEGLIDDNETSSWPYFAPLSFIIPTMACKTVNPNLVNGPLEHEASSSSFDNRGSVTSRTYYQSKGKSSIKRISTVPTTKTGQKRKINVAAGLEAVMEHALNILNNPVDDCDTFGEYVSMEIRNLKSDHNKARLKSEIRKVISRIADEDMNQFYFRSAATTIS